MARSFIAALCWAYHSFLREVETNIERLRSDGPLALQLLDKDFALWSLKNGCIKRSRNCTA
jgi:hypothetical protein